MLEDECQAQLVHLRSAVYQGTDLSVPNGALQDFRL